MSHQDMIDMLARLTVHMDEELRALAWQTLQSLIVECPEWREDVFHGKESLHPSIGLCN